MHDDCNRAGQPCSYWGDYGDWLCVLGQHRDSDILDKSNFDVACQILEEVDENCYVIERENHWAVGWVETLLVDPNNEQAIKAAEDIQNRLNDYPILDEEAYIEAEYNEFEESWDMWGRSDYVRGLQNKYPELENEIDDWDSEKIDELAYKAAQKVSWHYMTESSGVTINIEELVENTNL